jgi:preprotein translocase subunit YajC
MDWSTILLIVLMGGVFYFLMIRPQQKRAKETAKHLSSIEPGSRVMTISGIVGTIRYLGEKQVVLEVSPGVEITMDKRALSQQPVVDEFEYSDDEEPKLISDEALVVDAPEAEAAEAQVVEDSEPTKALEADQPTDGPTWDAPGTPKN